MVTVPRRRLINERIYRILFRKSKLPKAHRKTEGQRKRAESLRLVQALCQGNAIGKHERPLRPHG